MVAHRLIDLALGTGGGHFESIGLQLNIEGELLLS
jgi:hypothetical protein